MNDINSQVLALCHLHQWPHRDFITHWCQQLDERQERAQLLLSDQALTLALQEPELLELLPGIVYVLNSEIDYLRVHQPHLFENEWPIELVQISDERWVEMTLESQPVIVWESTDV